MAKLVNLKLEEITVGEGVRKSVDHDSILELSASFAKHGVLQPARARRVDPTFRRG